MRLDGTGALVRLVLRRDRIRLPVWIVALTGLVLLSALAVADAYPTTAAREAYATTIGSSPTAIAMAGPPVALTTLGGILVYETSMTALLGVALMAVFLVVRHTRADEEEGRTELLRSTVVGRDAHTAAATLVVGTACVLVGGGVTAAMLAAGAAAHGSVLFGAAVAGFGLFFTAAATVAAQLASHGRSAIGLALAFLGASFAVRAIGDMRESPISWVSPMSWPQQVLAFDADRWWPLALVLLATVVLAAITVRLTADRDLGAGILPSRPGPPHAARSLAGPVGLAARLQRGSVLGWSVGTFLTGVTFGSMSQELQELVESNPTFAEYFERSGGGSLVDAFFATALLIVSLLGGGFAVASALRVRSEETAGRTELLVTTGVTRWRWLLGNLAVTLAGTVLVVLAGGLGLGLSHAAVVSDPAEGVRLLADSSTYLPATLVLAALAVLLVGWLPQLTALAWAALAFCFVIGWLGQLLAPPAWVRDLSPFSHTPQVPAEAVSLGPLLVLTALTVALVAIGGAGFRRRDIG
jgi:ABC-2 type transport system permease protein